MKGEKRRLRPWTALVFAVCVSALIVGVAAGKIQVFAFWFLSGLAIGVAFHELGHLTCAAIGSISVYQIVIGSGPLLWHGRFGPTWLELRVAPLGGRVQPYPLLHYRRFWWALFLLGGVLGNLAVIFMLYGLQAVGAARNADDIMAPIMWVQVTMILVSLVPAGGNDGMLLLRMLRRRAEEPNPAQLGKDYGAFLSSNGKADTPFTMTAASMRLWFHGFRFRTNKDVRPEAREGMLHELHRGDLSREEKIWVLDALVTDGIVSGDPGVRPHLDAWSQQALALGPDLPALQGSRGAVLVELGRYDEGRALLAPLAAPGHAASFDAFISRAFLSLAEHGLGNEAAARQLADAARETAEAAGKNANMIDMLARLDREIARGQPTFRVLLFNDDATPMEFVVQVLEKIFKMDHETAIRLMLQVHHQGRSECGTYPAAVADAKAKELKDLAREHHHPLSCAVEPVPSG
jgi:ATP-dependent Clp protease adaptor protein ClpS